jgi:hypothetical protein
MEFSGPLAKEKFPKDAVELWHKNIHSLLLHKILQTFTELFIDSEGVI